MSNHTFRIATALLACGAALTFSACNKNDADDDDTTATNDTASTTVGGTTASVESAVKVADIDMGRSLDADRKIKDKTDDFKPKDSIYASVHTTGTAASTTIVARWMFSDGTLVEEQTQTIVPTGDAYTEFHIVKPSGFPKGKYTLHVLVDGKEVQTKDFEVE
jgi:hypothetical protein